MDKLLSVAVVLCSAVSAFAADNFEKKPEIEHAIIKAFEGNGFKIEVLEGENIRITPGGPAGIVAIAKVTGPLKRGRKAKVIRFLDGKPLIGKSGLEFEFDTTGKGEGSITIVLKGGPLGEKETTIKYTVVVK
ncbi:MAG: hypothetical protein NXI22_20625 [bacterium]|nr:hypothetical protein [bacterium]